MIELNVTRTITLTIFIGRLGSATERVKSSFHSGLIFFFTTRVFSFCIKYYQLQQINLNN